MCVHIQKYSYTIHINNKNAERKKKLYKYKIDKGKMWKRENPVIGFVDKINQIFEKNLTSTIYNFFQHYLQHYWTKNY